jgi:HSP20 family protein
MSQVLPERRSRRTARRWESQSEVDQVNERMRRLIEQTFGIDVPLPTEAVAWLPSVDIEETDDAYVVEAELPGVKREDVNIELVGNELIVSGEVKERERKGIVRRQTRRVGQFEYRVVLPDQVDSETIEAKLKDGVLSVRVPKVERAERRKIDIK